MVDCDFSLQIVMQIIFPASWQHAGARQPNNFSDGIRVICGMRTQPYGGKSGASVNMRASCAAPPDSMPIILYHKSPPQVMDRQAEDH